MPEELRQVTAGASPKALLGILLTPEANKDKALTGQIFCAIVVGFAPYFRFRM